MLHLGKTGGIESPYVFIISSKSGSIFVFKGKLSSSTAYPLQEINAHSGEITGISRIPENKHLHCHDTFLSLGKDKCIRFWKVFDDNKIIRGTTGDLNLSHPVIGSQFITLRSKNFFFVVLEDGSFVKYGDGVSGFEKVHVQKGNGRSTMKVTCQGETMALLQVGGLVSLWSAKGSQICQYEQRSSCILFTDLDNSPCLIMASQIVKFVNPFEAECVGTYGGHQGRILNIMSHDEKHFLSAAHDGKVNMWKYSNNILNSSYDSKSLGMVVAIEEITWEDKALKRFLVIGEKGTINLWKWSEDEVEHLSSSTTTAKNVRLAKTKWIDSQLNLALCTDTQLHLYLAEFSETILSLKTVFTMAYSLCRPINLSLDVNTFTNSMYAVVMNLETEDGKDKHNHIIRDPSRRCLSREEITTNQDTSNENKIIAIKRNTPTEYEISYENEEYTVAIGAEGEVSITDSEDVTRSLRLHARKVTGLVSVKGALVTSGEDGNLKCWRLGHRLTEPWVQTGLFSGSGPPFTSLTGGNGDRIVAGDAIGNIFCLALRRNISS